jgi:methionine-S-sulfoxide reductase
MKTKDVLLAGGCFWCIEAAIRGAKGVVDVVSVYASQEKADKVSYEHVVFKGVQAREAVLVTYDVEKTSFEAIVRYFFTLIDPLDASGQFFDRGFMYTTAVYVANREERDITEKIIQELNDSGNYDAPIVTVVEDRAYHYVAEDFHQKYKDKRPDHYARYYRDSGRQAFFGK